MTLVISDLDHFKSINDSYGHASGDRVIEAFSQFIHESKAGHHIAGRIGGEEFAIILPGTHLAAARLFAEGARSAFSALPIEGLPASRRFTASFGVAELVAGEGIDQLMRRADAALYEAKKDGRDCVRIAAGSMVELPADSQHPVVRRHAAIGVKKARWPMPTDRSGRSGESGHRESRTCSCGPRPGLAG